MVKPRSLSTSKMKFFVMIVNGIAKSPILDVPGVSGYIVVIVYIWLQCRCTFLVTGIFLTWQLFLFFLIRKKTHGTHCVKSVQIRSYFWSVFSRIWTEYGEILRTIILQNCHNFVRRDTCVYVLIYSIKCIHNIEYKMYLQNEKMPKLWVFVDFSNKRRSEQIYKSSMQNETVR